MSEFETTGISIIAEDPLIKSVRSTVDTLTTKVESYSHDIRATGGYWSASMTINDRQENIEDWIENGLGRHIVVYNPAGIIIWEGFVDKIDANLGPLSFSVGPMMEIGNKVIVVFNLTLFHFPEDPIPPTPGEATWPYETTREATSEGDDATSQTRYGVITKVVSATSLNALPSFDIAENLRDTWLSENSNPNTSGDINLSGQSGPSVKLSCKGYWHYLNRYIYSNTLDSEVDLSAKIILILNADPDTLYSADPFFPKITSNTIQVPTMETNFKRTTALLETLNSFGDASNNRYTMGLYANQTFVYDVIPSAIGYHQRITENTGVTNEFDGNLDPWDVTPGKWVFFPDFLPGKPPPTTLTQLRTDPRAGLVETVKFTSPNGLTLDANKVSQLDKVLARKGILGISS